MADIDPKKLKVVELRRELSKRGADTSGLKAVLIARLQEILDNELLSEMGGGDPEVDAEAAGDDGGADAAPADSQAEGEAAAGDHVADAVDDIATDAPAPGAPAPAPAVAPAAPAADGDGDDDGAGSGEEERVGVAADPADGAATEQTAEAAAEPAENVKTEGVAAISMTAAGQSNDAEEARRKKRAERFGIKPAVVNKKQPRAVQQRGKHAGGGNSGNRKTRTIAGRTYEVLPGTTIRHVKGGALKRVINATGREFHPNNIEGAKSALKKAGSGGASGKRGKKRKGGGAVSGSALEAGKRRKRQQRFKGAAGGDAGAEKKKREQRAARFAAPPISAEEAEKRRKRAERFGAQA